MSYTIGIDLGGTNIVAAVVDADFRIAAKASCKTNLPRTADEVADDMVKMSRQAAQQAGIRFEEVRSIGIGSPGTVNPVTGRIEYSCNFDFYDVPMAELVEQRTGKSCRIENDANAAAWGEYLAGAGRGTKTMVAITLGTGLGGGVILDGKIYSGFNCSGAELGHTVIVLDGRQCTCGRKGCFETYSSATGLIKTTRETMQRCPDSKLWAFAPSLDQVNGRTAFDALRAGDEAGEHVVQEYIRFLACGLTNVVNSFQPEILCIGGGVSREGDTLIQPVSEMISREDYARYSKRRTKVVAAQLGNDAGLIGAALLERAQQPPHNLS